MENCYCGSSSREMIAAPVGILSSMSLLCWSEASAVVIFKMIAWRLSHTIQKMISISRDAESLINNLISMVPLIPSLVVYTITQMQAEASTKRNIERGQLGRVSIPVSTAWINK